MEPLCVFPPLRFGLGLSDLPQETSGASINAYLQALALTKSMVVGSIPGGATHMSKGMHALTVSDYG
jgi:hypothetical protein